VAVSGNRACLAVGEAGISVLDVSSPAFPSLLFTLDTSGSANDVALAGGYAFVADGGAGLQIIDVTSPSGAATPLALSGYARGIAYASGTAYVAAGDAGLHLVDVTTPTAPAVLAQMVSGYAAQSVAVYGDYAYVSVGDTGVLVYDVSDPSDPQMVAGWGAPSGPGPSDVAALGSYAYLADAAAGFAVIDLLPPYSELAALNSPALAEKLAIVENGGLATAYTASREVGLQIVQVTDSTDATDPALVGENRELGDVTNVAVTGQAAYATTLDGYLSVLSTTYPANPTEDESVQTPGPALDVAVRGGTWYAADFYAYVADGDQGLRQISLLESPSAELNSVDTPGWASGVALAQIDGQYHAAVADGDSGLRLINVDSPTDAHEVSFYNTPGQARDVAVSGDYACVADGDAGVRIIDISQPAAPIEVGSYDTLGYAQGIAAANRLALVADGDNGLVLVSFVSPTAPVEIAHYDTPGRASGVAALEGHAYVADSGWGLSVLALWYSFRDVLFDRWSFTEIEWAFANGVTVGYPDGLYHPEIMCTRDQMAVYIARAHAGGDAGVPDYASAQQAFVDIAFSHWAWKYVMYCWDHGIVLGNVDTRGNRYYRPGNVVTRDIMAVFMARARGWISTAAPMGTEDELFFDIPAGFWAGAAIKACVDNDVVKGYPDGYYRPYRAVNRDQMAVYIYRTFGP
jgi:hypothetical protein